MKIVAQKATPTAVYLVAEIVGTRTSSGIRITLHLPVVKTAQLSMQVAFLLVAARVVIVLATVLLLIQNSPYVIVTQDQY